jgi:uncharacterized protein (DUF3820 family)
MKPNQHGLDYEMTFGKHRGKTLRQICEEEPAYIMWLTEVVKGFYVTDEVFKLARSNR